MIHLSSSERQNPPQNQWGRDGAAPPWCGRDSVAAAGGWAFRGTDSWCARGCAAVPCAGAWMRSTRTPAPPGPGEVCRSTVMEESGTRQQFAGLGLQQQHHHGMYLEGVTIPTCGPWGRGLALYPVAHTGSGCTNFYGLIQPWQPGRHGSCSWGHCWHGDWSTVAMDRVCPQVGPGATGTVALSPHNRLWVELGAAVSSGRGLGQVFLG